MRLTQLLFVVVATGAVVSAARAADPVVVELTAAASAGTSVITIGDVARVTGGDAVTRARVARTDIADLKAREPRAVVGRRAVEYRLLLAGFDPAAVRVTGAESAVVTLARRAVTVEEVTAAARAELFRQHPNPADVAVELAVPVVVKLPEVPADERVVIDAKVRGKPPESGRVQMDMSVAIGGEKLISFAVHLNVSPLARAGTVAQAGAQGAGTQFAAGELLVRPRQRVQMEVHSGGLKVTAVGEAQQGGKFGQTILVQNVDSKKTISARVTGPGTVEVDLGGAP